MSMIELERRDPPGAARAAMMLQRAHWAAETFARYDRARVVRILDAVAEAAEAHAERYAERYSNPDTYRHSNADSNSHGYEYAN